MELEARAYDVHFATHENIDTVPNFRIQVFDARSGDEVPVMRHNGSLKVSGDYSLISDQGTITPARPGSYLIVTTTHSKPIDASIALQKNKSDDFARAWRGAIVTGLVFSVAGLMFTGLNSLLHRRRQPW